MDAGTVSRERLDQKRRTRAAILAGARDLMERGEPVTVAQAAKVAGVSKATAYRYFTDPATLTAEAGLAARVATYEEIVAGAEGLRARLLAITLYFFDYPCDNEVAFRQFLARYLDAWLADRKSADRGARRAVMFERALREDGNVPPPAWPAIVNALTLVTGAEAMITLFDIAHLDRAGARATVRATAEALIEHHLGAAQAG
ncbi:TetR/AcrR family transcriptional regulator [Amaricoccus solimangrovi]|nr:TetR/AcrR family transcriptional regulator [Amaricoccus solimangrovi]